MLTSANVEYTPRWRHL